MGCAVRLCDGGVSSRRGRDRGRRRGGCRGRTCAVADASDHGVDTDGLPFLDQNLSQRSGRGLGDFGVHLVG